MHHAASSESSHLELVKKNIYLTTIYSGSIYMYIAVWTNNTRLYENIQKLWNQQLSTSVVISKMTRAYPQLVHAVNTRAALKIRLKNETNQKKKEKEKNAL